MPRKSSVPNNLKRSPFNVRESVGRSIKRRRLTLGWSQQELADRFGVSRAAISQYELGTGEVNAGDLPRLADLLGIRLLEFYGVNGTVETTAAFPEKHGTTVLGQDPDKPQKEASTAFEEIDVAEKIDIADITPVVSGVEAGVPGYPFIIQDRQQKTALTIIPAIEREYSPEMLPHLARLVGQFLSLSPSDQATLLRVADALHSQAQAKSRIRRTKI